MSSSMDPAIETRPQRPPYTAVRFPSGLKIGDRQRYPRTYAAMGLAVILVGAIAASYTALQVSDDPIRRAVAQTDMWSQVPVSPEEGETVAQNAQTNDVSNDTQSHEHLPTKTSNQELQPLDSSSARFASDGENGNISAPRAIEEKLRSLDTGRTAATAPAPPVHVEIAETEEEVISLEAQMARDAPETFTTIAGEEPPVAEPQATRLQEAWATSFVNLRAAPSNDADVIAVVPEEAQIMAENGCVHWCEADYNGQRGFIYNAFIRR